MARDRSYAKLGTDVADLDAAAGERLLDAEALFAGGRYASSVALGLYALEIALKAKTCRRLDLGGLPRPFEIHELDELLVLCGLSRRLDDPQFLKVKANWDSIVIGQAPHVNDLRYLPGQHVTRVEAEDFLRQLRDPPDGVLPWLSTQP